MAKAKRGASYFAEQLKGEEPLRHATAMRLCQVAAAIGEWKPWRMLTEDDVIAVQRREGAEPEFVSVLGAVGVSRSVTVHPGLRGYGWLRRMAEGDEEEVWRLMVTEREMLSVDYEENEESLGELDRQLLEGCRWMGWPLPVKFRSVRPGYCPWYLTDGEGEGLAECLEAVYETFSRVDLATRKEELWLRDSGGIPAVRRGAEGWRLGMMNLRWEREKPAALWIPEEELAGLPGGRGEGEVCVGTRLPRELVEGENGRPAYLQVVAVVDGETGMALRLVVAEPGHVPGETLARELVAACRERGKMPETVSVPSKWHRDLLTELGRRLGVRVRVRKRMPVVETLFRELEKWGWGRSGGTG